MVKQRKKCQKKYNQNTSNSYLCVSINCRKRSCNAYRISFEIRTRRSFLAARCVCHSANPGADTGQILLFTRGVKICKGPCRFKGPCRLLDVFKMKLFPETISF